MAKRSVILITLAIAILLGGTSCKKDCDETVIFTSLEEAYDCENTSYQVDVELKETYTIIRSQSEFDNQVTGSCTPTIDFEMYDLVIGKKGLSSGFSSITYQVIRDCPSGNYEVTVDIQSDATLIAPNITYHVLVPKLGDEQTAIVDINVL